MKSKKSMIESGLVAFAVVSMLSFTNVTETTVHVQSAYAKAVGPKATIEQMVVAQGGVGTPTETSTEDEGTIENVQVVSEWASKAMANVEEFVNIRVGADAESALAGKLHKGDAAAVLERGAEWTKISSGSVEGYVKNEYLAFDDSAKQLAEELGSWSADVKTEGLRLRTAPSVDSDIYDVVELDETLKVDKATEPVEGWVAIRADEQTVYVSAEYVEVYLKLGEAISIEEEQAIIAAQKAAEEAAAAAAAESAQKASRTSDVTRTQEASVAASYDDVTLLGALIQCEAGGESYEGMVAVGAVVMNRVRSGSYPSSIYDVIYQNGQFTPAGSGSVVKTMNNGVSGSCLSAAQEAINGANNVGGALGFAPTSTGKGGLQIGNHVFY